MGGLIPNGHYPRDGGFTSPLVRASAHGNLPNTRQVGYAAPQCQQGRLFACSSGCISRGATAACNRPTTRDT